jgi:hypothetical protein
MCVLSNVPRSTVGTWYSVGLNRDMCIPSLCLPLVLCVHVLDIVDEFYVPYRNLFVGRVGVVRYASVPQDDVNALRRGTVLTKVTSSGKMHQTKVTLRLVGDSEYFVCWESESFWKSAADCQCTLRSGAGRA